MSEKRSPIEIMIDQACGYRPAQYIPTEAQKEEAKRVANEILWHIDEMYPAMWKNVAKTARKSIRNTAISAVLSLLRSATPPNEQR